jgi:gliding motility-associated-like protein
MIYTSLHFNNYFIIVLLVLASVIAQAQTATISADKQNGCATHSAKFTASSNVNINTYSWTTSDGQSSSLASPTFFWNIPGNYSVNLKINSSPTSSSYSVIVFKNPIADFTAIDTTVCIGTQVSFTNSTTLGDSPITNWKWDFGDGNTSTLENPLNTYNTIGSNTVTLTATDQNGCVGKKTNISIDVYSAPTVGITNTPNNLISCTSPFNVDFNSNVTGGSLPYTYSWDFGNGLNSNLSNPSINTYTAYQNYTVTLTVKDGNSCIITNTKIVSLAQFDADIKAINNDTICKGGIVTFQDNTIGAPISWNWNLGNGNSSSLKNPPIQTYPNPGSYPITLITTNAQQCKDTATLNLVVLDDEIFDFKADTTIGCQPLFRVIFDVIPVSPGASYSWNFGNAGTGNGSTYTHNFPEGTYDASCTITNRYGCVTTITKNSFITVNQPQANFNADTTKGCAPLSVDFLNQSDVGFNGTNGNTATYSWIFENVSGGTTSSTSTSPQNVIYPDSGEFDVTLIITNALGCKDTTLKRGFIQPGLLPTANFIANPLIGCHPLTVEFTDSSSEWVDEWNWDFGGPGTSTEENPKFNYDTWHPTGPSDTGYFDIRLVVGHHQCYDTLIVDSLIFVKGPSPRFHIFNQGIKDDYVSCNYESRWFMFRDTSLTQRATSTYFWDFGDQGSGLNNFSNNKDTVWHYFANPGSYTVELKIYDASTGCTDSVQNIVIVSDFNASISAQDNVCVDIESIIFTGSFTDLANTNGPVLTGNSWIWNYGDGSTNEFITAPNNCIVSHIYNNPNLNTIVTLIASNSVGCMDTVYKDIKVKQLPTANFTATPTTGCSPLSVDFTDVSIAAANATITNWTWTLDSGIISYLKNPQDIIYVGSGSKTILLYVKDSEGCVSDTFSTTITINDPKAFLTVNDADSTICSGSQFTFSSVGSGPTPGLQYSWAFGDGGSINFSSSNTASHVYNVNLTDTFTVSLFVKDALACIDSASKEVIVSKPYADFFINNPIADCAPITFYLNNTNSSNDVTNVTYIFGDGTGLNQIYSDSLAHTWQSPGLYSITYIVTNIKGCKDTISRNNYVSVGGPTASFDYTPKNGCPPLTVTFSTSGVNNVSSYQFFFGDGSDTIINVNSTSTTFNHTYYNSNNYLPAMLIKDTLNTLIGDLVYCPRTVVGDSTISLKGPIVGFTVDTNFQCSTGIPFNFIDTTDNNNSSTTGIIWEFGDGQTISLTNTTDTVPHAYNTVGYFDVSLTYFSAPNCTSKVTQPSMVNVFKGPDLNLDITGSGCPPYGKKFNSDTVLANISGIYAQTINWDFGDGDSSILEDPFHVYTNSGSYTPVLTINFSNGCDFSYQNTGSIIVNELPVAGFSTKPVYDEFDIIGYNFIDSSLNAINWNWTFGDNSASNEENPQHLYLTEGEYQVQLIVTNQFGCLDTAIQILNYKRDVYIPNILSLDGSEQNQTFNIRLPEKRECIKLWVYDRWGKLRYENLNYKNDWKGTDLSGKRLPVDTYYYIINFCDRLTYNGWVYIHYNE